MYSNLASSKTVTPDRCQPACDVRTWKIYVKLNLSATILLKYEGNPVD